MYIYVCACGYAIRLCKHIHTTYMSKLYIIYMHVDMYVCAQVLGDFLDAGKEAVQGSIDSIESLADDIGKQVWVCVCVCVCLYVA